MVDYNCDETGLVAMDTEFSSSFLENLITGGHEIAQSTTPFADLYPPGSMGSPAVGCATKGHQCNLDPRVSHSPLSGTKRERPWEQGWYQLTSAHCNEARITILNPKEGYSKVQKRRGPRGRFSLQGILNGEVPRDSTVQSILYELSQTCLGFIHPSFYSVSLGLINWLIAKKACKRLNYHK